MVLAFELWSAGSVEQPIIRGARVRRQLGEWDFPTAGSRDRLGRQHPADRLPHAHMGKEKKVRDGGSRSLCRCGSARRFVMQKRAARQLRGFSRGGLRFKAPPSPGGLSRFRCPGWFSGQGAWTRVFGPSSLAGVWIDETLSRRTTVSGPGEGGGVMGTRKMCLASGRAHPGVARRGDCRLVLELETDRRESRPSGFLAKLVGGKRLMAREEIRGWR